MPEVQPAMVRSFLERFQDQVPCSGGGAFTYAGALSDGSIWGLTRIVCPGTDSDVDPEIMDVGGFRPQTWGAAQLALT